MEDTLVKMSPKGQLVVPQSIREEEDFSPGDRFVAIPLREGVLFKKIEMPKVKVQFEKLSKEIREHFESNQVAPNDVDEAIKWARKR